MCGNRGRRGVSKVSIKNAGNVKKAWMFLPRQHTQNKSFYCYMGRKAGDINVYFEDSNCIGSGTFHAL